MVALPSGPSGPLGPPLVSKLFSSSDVLIMSGLDAIKGYVLLCLPFLKGLEAYAA